MYLRLWANTSQTLPNFLHSKYSETSETCKFWNPLSEKLWKKIQDLTFKKEQDGCLTNQTSLGVFGYYIFFTTPLGGG